MTTENAFTSVNQRTSVSALMNSVVMDVHGHAFGRVREFAVAPTIDAAHVQALLVRRSAGEQQDKASLVPIASLRLTEAGVMQMRGEENPARVAGNNDFLLLERDLLDQQIIDVHGHKVVRVNDVDLVWEGCSGDGNLCLRIAEVEVGLRGAVRRLLKGLPAATIEQVACRLRPSVIPWEFVDLIDRDPARRVKLKIEQERLSRMHPSDIADILEELAPAERQALFRSLDEEVAAEALEEADPKLQRALIEGLDSESVAGIVEEMDPGAAADLLAELTEERSDAILEEMDPEERQEVEDLLEFASDSAAGQMTTDYIALPADSTVDQAITALHDFEGDAEAVTDIYLIDEEGHVQNLVPLVRLLLSQRDAQLSTLMTGHLVACSVNDRVTKVAELFDKYNLRSLPVVNEKKLMVGVILAEHVIAQLREK